MTHHQHSSRADSTVPGRSAEPWPSSWWRNATLRVSGAAVRAIAGTAELARQGAENLGLPAPQSDMREQLARWHDRQDWPQRPIRIGVINPGAWATPLTPTSGGGSCDWFRVERLMSPARACEEFVLDAAVSFLSSDGVQATTLERPEAEAAWFDWAAPRPLSYTSLFPLRLDCSRLSLGNQIDADSPNDADLARHLIEAAAVLARSQPRLTLTDRMIGRRPLAASAAPTAAALRPLAPAGDPARDTMRRLAGSLVIAASQPRHSKIARTASRIIAAWAATADNLTDSERQLYAEAAARISGDEAETMLRLAAVRLGCLDDSGGFDSLERADRMLRNRELHTTPQQEAVVHAELQQASSPLAIGRAAAGLCTLTARMSADALRFYLADTLDELGYTDTFLGRDQDQWVLAQLARRLEKARRGETFSLPMQSSAAASQSPTIAASPASSSTDPRATSIATEAAPTAPRKRRPARKTTKPRTNTAKKPAARKATKKLPAKKPPAKKPAPKKTAAKRRKAA